MPEESFLLVSLDGQKSKKLAEVISNDTCRRILEALAKKEHTETELSTTLNIPLSTVHYNLKNLVEARLVVAEEYHYSKRGKEILHYKLANKLIIIAPQQADATKAGEILKKYLLAATSIVAVGIVMSFFTVLRAGSTAISSASMKAVDAAQTTHSETVPRLMAAATSAAAQASAAEPSVTAWFLTGAFVALFVMLAIDLVRGNRKQKNP